MYKTMMPLAFAASLLLGASAHAQSPASPDPSAVQGGVYAVEPAHTQVMFSVLHIGFTSYGGVFSKASGELKLDPKTLAATELNVSVPVTTVATTSTVLDDELRGAEWLDAGKYPAMTFHSTKITKTGPATADVAGELSIHGVTRPVVLKARFIGAGVNPLDKSYTAGFQVSGEIKRSEFGVTKYVPLISDEVHLTINAAFHKKAS
ncbi:MAG: YceI family protein [Caulobacteraceae bacterium]